MLERGRPSRGENDRVARDLAFGGVRSLAITGRTQGHPDAARGDEPLQMGHQGDFEAFRELGAKGLKAFEADAELPP